MTHLTDVITLTIVLVAILVSVSMGRLALIRANEITGEGD